jgi:NADH-quinone oxidoreductase subunit E
MDFVAHYLGMPPIAVYEVAIFYTMYDLKPGGSHKMRDLHQSAVRAAGRQDAASISRKARVGFNETTPDGASRCKEANASAPAAMRPVVLVNNKRMCFAMTPDRLDALLKELK